VRIISGTLKGRRFQAPKSIPARPTTDYAKEALFNVLQHEVEFNETDMLDLFAGIGSISLEAVSRDVRSLTSVDLNHTSTKWLGQLKTTLHLSNWTIHKSDAIKWLKRSEKRFDFVFADPPYEYKFHAEVISLVLESALTTDGIFVLEHRHSTNFADHPNFVGDKTYGEVRFSFFEKT